MTCSQNVKLMLHSNEEEGEEEENTAHSDLGVFTHCLNVVSLTVVTRQINSLK